VKISKRSKLPLLIVAGISIAIFGPIFYIILAFMLVDINASPIGLKYYQADLSGKWSTYQNKELDVSFEYPSEWTVKLGNYSNCIEGKAVWISNTHARAHIIMCKAPNIKAPVSLPSTSSADLNYSIGWVVKKIKTPYTTFYSTNLDKNSDLSITDQAISEDKNIVLNVQIPYTSETGIKEIQVRDKIFIRILNSIKNYE
jgi:hypothetical protein